MDLRLKSIESRILFSSFSRLVRTYRENLAKGLGKAVEKPNIL